MIRINSFQGTFPAVEPRLQKENYAITARNCLIEMGNIIQIKPIAFEVDIGVTINSIYPVNSSTWKNFTTADVKPIPSFLRTDDRYYYADGTQVRQADSAGNDFPLGVPKPASAPTNQIQGTASDTTVIWSGQYVYTYITAWGEESKPSEPTGSLDVLTGQYIKVSAFSTPPANHNITHIRLYRLVTGTARSEYEQVDDDIPISTTDYDDHLEDDELLGTILPSTNWSEPPDTLKGIIEYANQVLIGFDEDKVYLTEPGFPHAWPYEYEMSNSVIGIANAGGSCFAMTTGHPVMLTGNDPSMVQQIELPYDQPCECYGGIVETPYGVVYPCPDGLFFVNASTGNLITKGVYTRAQWQEYDISSMDGFLYNGEYYGFFIGTAEAIIVPLNDQTGARSFDLLDMGYYTDADYRCGYIDGDTLYVVYDNLYYDTAISGRWRGIFDNNNSIDGKAVWKSKKFYSDGYSYIGAIQAHGDEDITVKIYTDGTLRETLTLTDNEYTACQGGYLAREFQFELQSIGKIRPPFSAAKTVYELVQQV